MATKQEILIGCDPEVFLKAIPKRGKYPRFVSAHGLIPGTKKEPFPVKDGAIQVDGVALEFNIEPAKTAAVFVQRINTVLEAMQKKLWEKAPGHEYAFVPSALFDAKYFAKIPEEAKVLGCEPDFNAYTMAANPRPETDRPFRTASGHIHIGWTSGKDVTDVSHLSDCALVAKQMDASLGVYSKQWDGDNERRQLYGAPGAFRPKPYGMEYRTLSNAWLRTDYLKTFVFNTAKHAMELMFDGQFIPTTKDFLYYGGDGIEKSLSTGYGYTRWLRNNFKFTDYNPLAEGPKTATEVKLGLKKIVRVGRIDWDALKEGF